MTEIFKVQNNIKPLTLVINKDLWEKFKETVQRDNTLNDAVVDLIKKSIEARDFEPRKRQ